MASSQTGSSASYLCWTLDVGRSALATPKLSAYAGSTFFFRHGRVAESGLRHSTRNRAWGNPPWVRIPPLPPNRLGFFGVGERHLPDYLVKSQPVTALPPISELIRSQSNPGESRGHASPR